MSKDKIQSNLTKLLKSQSCSSIEQPLAGQPTKPQRIPSAPQLPIRFAYTPNEQYFHIGRQKKKKSPLKKYIDSIKYSSEDSHKDLHAAFQSKEDNESLPGSPEQDESSGSTETIFTFEQDILGSSNSPEDSPEQRVAPLGLETIISDGSSLESS